MDMEPEFKAGDKATFLPLKVEVEVVRQILHYDMGDEFYGNVVVKHDGKEHTVNCWQLRKLTPDRGG